MTEILKDIKFLVGNKIGPLYVRLALPPKEVIEPTESNIESLYESVWQWHGTGRYQNRNGSVVDILQTISSDGGLVPHYDEFDPVAGPLYSISTSPSRIYARLYAGMHFEERCERSYLLGDTARWVNYFMGVSSWEVIKEFKLYKYVTPKRMIREFMTQYRIAEMGAKWMAKVRLDSSGMKILDTFIKGSDIPGNFPILIGIMRNAFKPILTSKSIARLEQRSIMPIPLSAMTHIEVPAENMHETARIIGNNQAYPLPILPLQLGEKCCKPWSFTRLVGGSKD